MPGLVSRLLDYVNRSRQRRALAIVDPYSFGVAVSQASKTVALDLDWHRVRRLPFGRITLVGIRDIHCFGLHLFGMRDGPEQIGWIPHTVFDY